MSGWTLGFQIVNFLILAVLLERLLFRPVRAMVERRREELERLASEARGLRRAADELHGQAERDVAARDDEQSRVLAEARDQAERERHEQLGHARREAAAIVEHAREEVAVEREKAAEALVGEAVVMGTAVARRLLEQVSTAGVAEPFLERLSSHLDTLTRERKQQLREELGDHELVIAVAPAPSTDAANRWVSAVRRRLGDGFGARIVTDESLVAGAELRFPHTTLSFCWRDALEGAREGLLHHADRR